MINEIVTQKPQFSKILTFRHYHCMLIRTCLCKPLLHIYIYIYIYIYVSYLMSCILLFASGTLCSWEAVVSGN